MPKKKFPVLKQERTKTIKFYNFSYLNFEKENNHEVLEKIYFLTMIFKFICYNTDSDFF